MMKVQWALVDVESKTAVAVGDVFETVDHDVVVSLFDGESRMSSIEATVLFGDDPIMVNHPDGVIKFSDNAVK